MEKGIEENEEDLYKQTEQLADNVLNSLENVKPEVGINGNINGNGNSSLDLMQNLDYNKLFNILYEAFLKALNSCKLSIDEDGFAKIVKDELYKVV